MKNPALASIGVVAALAAMGPMGPGCAPANVGTPGNAAVSRPNAPGTVFTILFENEDQSTVQSSQMPYLQSLIARYGSASAYTVTTHPSLPNYLLLTSGLTHGVGDDGPPSSHPIAGNDNLPDQLDAAHIPWRAYMQSMGDPCQTQDVGRYIVHHDPFVYYDSVRNDSARCQQHVVDFDQNFAADLASDQYRYMWITPNACYDMHDCAPNVSDAWLQTVIPQIMASPGYQRGGAIFLLWDEGGRNLQYVLGYLGFGAQQNVAAVVISPNIAHPGVPSDTGYNHLSYLATVEDMLGLPRLATTQDAVPMSDLFTSTAASANDPSTTVSPSPDAGTSDAATTH
jgi:hypothetical protein